MPRYSEYESARHLPDPQEDIRRLREERILLQTQVETLQKARAHDQYWLALLLEAASGYRDAHAAMHQELCAGSPGMSQFSYGQDKGEVKLRLQELSSAQTALFSVIELVQEKASRISERGITPK